MILLSTLHDPEGRFPGIKGFENTMKSATQNYGKALINITKITSPKSKSLVRKYFDCIESGTGTQGKHVINLMKNAAKHDDNFHYCDFDRLIHWQLKYPKELSRTVKQISRARGFVFINRTKRAFENHPETQKDTETVMNMLISEYVGKEVDMASGTFGFDSRTCRLFSKVRGNVSEIRFLAHFLACIKKNKIPFSCVQSEGMEWETPDVYQSEIKSMGYEKWLSQFQSHREWRRRVESVRQIAEILAKN